MLIQKSTQFNIDLNAEDFLRRTALHLVSQRGHSNVAQILILKSTESKINLNAKDRCGYTALHLASLHGHSKVVDMFPLQGRR